MAQLPIRKLTLYKQGVGYFEREGGVEDSRVTLVVPRDSVNDVLKSMSVVVRRGGQVLGVDYETPEDKQKVLDSLPVRLSDRSSLVDMLSGLRGSRLVLALADREPISGRVIGVEASLDPGTHPARLVLQMEDAAAQIHVLPLADIQTLSLQDEQAATDVKYLLDVNRTEQTRTALTVRLSETRNELSIGYLAPCPVWRVSYRLLGDEKGQARLMAWGVFDNWLDEDLEEVQLVLLSGRPISFEYKLYESHVPARPEVSDIPSALETMSGSPMLAESLANISHELRSPLNTIIGFARVLERDGDLNKNQKADVQVIVKSGQRMLELVNDLLDMARLRQRGSDDIRPLSTFYRSGPLGDLKVSNSYFMPVMMGNAESEYMTYAVQTPVSVRRGQSAMVPLLDQVVEYSETCVYNGDKMPNHPLRVWRIRNTTGKTLEQGPAALVDGGRYIGEGLLRFTGVGDEFHLPYALEFGILVSHESKAGESGTLDVQFDGKKREAVLTQYEIVDYHYTFLSHLEREVRVLLERRDPNRGDRYGGEYFEMPEPVLTSEGHSRWAVTVPAGGEAAFSVRIRTTRERRDDLDRWDRAFVRELRERALLPETALARLDSLLDTKQKLLEADGRLKSVQADYDQVVSRQDHLRKNLEALGTSEREIAIRNGILDDLELSENRRRELERTIREIDEQMKADQQTRRTLVDELYGAEAR
jgi:hypothetical protein